MLAKLESDHILKVHHAESINEDDAFFVTPYCAAGDLDDALAERKFGTIEAIDVLIQIAAGVSFLHGSGYLHRDLKPANIFCLSDNRFVIGDFGSVVTQNSEGISETKTRHSLIYRPPEEISDGKFRKQGDIYQLGLGFYQILGGDLPYEERGWLNDKQKSEYDNLSGWEQQAYAKGIIESRIVRGKILDLSTLPPWTPAAFKTLIRRCCNIEWTERYSAVADVTGRLNNLRSKTPDWRIGEYPVLHRKKHQYRVVPQNGRYAIEKKVTAEWRREKAHTPANLSEAVQIAEQL